MSLESISKIKEVIEAKELTLSNEVKKILGKKLSKKAENISKKIRVYRIIYKSNKNKVVGYILEPKLLKNKLPCIIWNRGGSRDFGAIKMGKLFGGFGFMAELCLEGYIVIATQYPGVAGGTGIDKMGGKEDIDSVLDLYKILKSYKKADTSRVGMIGHSRGGLMTYLSLKKVKWIKAAVIGSAPTDEVNAHKFRKDWLKHQITLYGGGLDERKKRSPILWANKLDKKPILLVHGTSDWRVNPLNSINMAEKLLINKVPYKLIIYEGDDHGLNKNFEDYKKQTFEWFNRFVKNKGKMPNLKPHGP